MTPTKNSHKRTKVGRKTKREMSRQGNYLIMLTEFRNISPWQASLIVGCGYEYALNYFRELGYVSNRNGKIVWFYDKKFHTFSLTKAW